MTLRSSDYRAAWQPRVTAGIAPCGSCLQQPTRTVRIGHGSPPFHETAGQTIGATIPGLAQPTRGVSRVTVGRHWEATRVATGKPDLVSEGRPVRRPRSPSTARRRALSPGNALPGTTRKKPDPHLLFPASEALVVAPPRTLQIYAACAEKIKQPSRPSDFFPTAAVQGLAGAGRVHKRRYNE